MIFGLKSPKVYWKHLTLRKVTLIKLKIWGSFFAEIEAF